MRKLFVGGGLAAIVLSGALAVPAQAAPTIDGLARQECREERRTDPNEYRRDYGSGDGAFRRCVSDQKRDAWRDCREDRREERAEFRAEYNGTGKAAMRRCVRDELR
ncbi:MAG TPA: hypothetical protein VNO82_19190 [Solirubrobacteraceae bacterium]|nr:hypothetical protein [Solirubrobacteraceae bacterium]